MVAVFMKGGGAKKVEVQFVVEVGVLPEGFVGGGGLADLALVYLEGAVLEGNGGGRLPVFEGGAEGFVKGGDLKVVGVGGAEVDGAIVWGSSSEEAGEGEGFFGLVVV